MILSSRFFHPLRRSGMRVSALCVLTISALLSSAQSGGNAIANGESRTISIYHTHTGESLTIEYKRNGSFDRDALEKLNWLLRDWRRDEPTSMDPRLFDIVWEAQRSVGSTAPINVVSAYRSPETNAMLRRQSKAVAKNSQHMLGKAMDFYLTDANITDIREIGMRMQRGGVGYYPNAYTPFVHLDAGSVRHWPRMSHDELARLFPDGKTVHIPSDGRPLEHYAEAEQEILANGGTVLGTSFADAGDVSVTSKPKSLWAVLFGGGNEEDDNEVLTQKPVSKVAIAKVAPADENGEGADTPASAILTKGAAPKPMAMAALPALTSFKSAVPAPHAPMPLARPGSSAPLLAMNGNGSSLVWQTGSQPLKGGQPVPLPPALPSRGDSIGPANASASVPLPPIPDRIPGRVAATEAPQTDTPSQKAELPTLLATGRGKPSPTLALAYAPTSEPTAPAVVTKPKAVTVTAKAASQKANESPAPAALKSLSAEAIMAAKLPASGAQTRFSLADDPAPINGHFSTKMTAVCSAKAVAAGQACMPSASR